MKSHIALEENPIITIDRKDVLLRKKKFLHANQRRIDRAIQALEYNQQLIFELLPLLFHVNHPMLPGYVTQNTPCGLSGYKPSELQLKQVKKLSRSFRYQAINARGQAILSIFVMGSMGTLGQTRHSDLDIWVCFDPKLTHTEIDELKKKCNLIAQWAQQYHLELCFFPINNLAFKAGESTPLSEESSGSTQHHLLLDEFYRSALYLGGRLPLWWFVPYAQEDNYQAYCQHLLNNKFIRENEVVDLGGLCQIPAHEFITAAIWQMYKAIQSPYKSLLKLVLLETYAHQYPAPHFLAHQYKQYIELDACKIDDLDPYLLLLTNLEQYLDDQNSSKRLEMVRRCFYFKVDKALSKSKPKTHHSWQRALLQQQVTRWHWRDDQLERLDNRKQWRAIEVMDERKRLVSDLMSSYRLLSEFVRQHDNQNSPLHAEITILGRKLYAAFERKAGKVEWINPDISPDISESDLLFIPHLDDSGLLQWRLFAHRDLQHVDPSTQLKSSRSLAELIIWAYCNEIFSKDSRALVKTHRLEATERPEGAHHFEATTSARSYSLQDLFLALSEWQSLPLPAPKQHCYTTKPYPQSIMLVCNLESSQEPIVDHDASTLNAFNVGENSQSLIQQTHLAVLNSWNELSILSPRQTPPASAKGLSTGDIDMLPNLITELLLLIPSQSKNPLPKISVFCRASPRSQSIKQRLELLLKQLISCFHSTAQPSHARFILQYAGRYHLWQYRTQVHHRSFDSEALLYRYLAESQTQLSPIVFDRYSLRHSPVQAMTNLPSSKAIQVGYRRLPQDSSKSSTPQAEIYVLDERGSLFIDRVACRDEHSLLRPLHQFIRTAIDRLCLTQQHQEFFGVYPVEFYRLSAPLSADSQWLCQRIEITTELHNLNFFNIQAIANNDDIEQLDLSFYCDEQEFHSLDYGTKLYRRVASYILAKRRQAERYPCYITDLDLSRSHSDEQGQSRQMVDYLRVKSKLEIHLNRALQSI